MATAKNIRGITIEIAGNTAPLEKALKSVNATLKTTQKDLTDINRLLKVDPSNVTLLKQKQEALNTAVQATREKLEKEKQALEQLQKQPKTDEVIDQQNRLGREIMETEQKLQGLETELKQFGSVAKQQIQAAADKIGEMGTKVKAIGQSVSGVGDKLTTAVTLPIVAAGTAATKAFADVDKTMQLVNKTMNNTAEEAELLNNAMQEAAANSVFGMDEAATATLNFARAGLTAAEAATALAPAMNLAAGEGGTLDTVSAGLTATINAFGDSFSNTSKYADIFAAACNNSALDVDSLSSSMSIAAPIFAAAGYSIEDAALYMGVMANAGIDANTAATALKTGLARLAKPAKDAKAAMKEYNIEVFNADGTMKDSITVQKELNKAFAGMTEQEQLAAAAAIFGKNQMSNWLALINTAPAEVEALSDSIKNAAGTTEEMADAMMSGFGGSIEKLKSSLNVLSTSIGGLIAEYITPLIEKVQAAVDKFNAMDKASQQQIIKIAAIVAALGPLLSIGGRIITGVGTLMELVPKITAAVGALNPAIAATVAVVGLLAAAYIKMATYEVEAIDHTDLLTEEQKKLADSAKAVIDSTKKSADAHKSTLDNIKNEKDATKKLIEELRNYTDASGNVIENQTRVKEIVGELNALLPELNLAYNEQTQSLSMNTDEIERNIDAMLRKAETAAMEERLTEIMKERIEVQRQMAGMETMVAEAEQAAADAAREFHAAYEATPALMDSMNTELEVQNDRLLLLKQAQMDAAVACSEATGPYYELKATLEELDAEEEYLVDQIGGTNTAINSQGDAAQTLADAISESTDEMESSWNELAETVGKSINSQIDLFGELKKQEEISKDALLKNMDDQVGALEEWSQNLQELSKKGISEGLLQELAKMGPEGAAKVAAFNEMSSAELAKASQLFDEATKIPGETIAQMEKNYDDFGRLGWTNYVKSYNRESKVAAQQAQIDAQPVGENMGKGVIQGAESQEGNVIKAGKKMGKDAVDGVAEGAGVRSPSRLTRETGQHVGEGLVLGLNDKVASVRNVSIMVARACTDTIREGLNTSTFHQIGASIGQALADGLNSMIAAVEAAANRLIQAAQRAGQAAASVGVGSGAGASASANNGAMANAMTAMNNTLTSPAAVNNVNNSTAYNYGGVTIPIYAAAGQDVNAIAAAVEDILLNQVNRQEGAFA